MNSHNPHTGHHQDHLSEAQLLRYQSGQMNPREMHLVERHLLDCALCNEALEGIALAETKASANAFAELKNRLHQRIKEEDESKKGFAFWPMGIAASILLILAFGLVYFVKIGPNEKEELSFEQEYPIKEVEEEVIYPKEDSTVQEQAKPALPPVKPIKKTRKILVEKTQPEYQDTITNAQTIEEKKPLLVFLDVESLEEVEIADEQTQEESPGNKTINSPHLAKAEPIEIPAESTRSKSTTLSGEERNSKGERYVTGKVISFDDGSKLPGVNVNIKGSRTGTITDLDGNFKIVIPEEGAVLVFNYVGFSTEEVLVGNKNVVNAELMTDLQTLSEVVVIGYGESESAEKTYNIINPRPEDGFRKYKKYLRENLRYPEQAKQNKIQAKVKVEFYVNTDGSLSDFSVKKPHGYGLDEEAIRLIKEGSKWKPATDHGNPFREKVTMKIVFKLKE